MKNFKFTIKKVEQLKTYQEACILNLFLYGCCVTDPTKIEFILFPPKPFAYLTNK